MNPLPAQPVSHTVTHKGLRLHHVEWGAPGGDALVMLHGIRLHAHCWGHFGRRFAGGYRVLALDARGHGESDWARPEDYHLQDFYEDLHAVLESRNLPPVTLIGHSLGARVAMLYTHLHPQGVARLVLVDMGPGLPAAALNRDFSRVTETPQPQEFGSHEEAVDYLAALLSRAPREMIEESVRHGMRPAGDGKFAWRYDPALGGVPLSHKDKREWDLWQVVETIACPTLLVYGADSRVVTPDIAGKVARIMPDCRVERIENAGHALFTEQPEEFARSVGRFLDETSKAAQAAIR